MLKEKRGQEEVDLRLHLEGGSISACDFAALGTPEGGVLNLVKIS